MKCIVLLEGPEKIFLGNLYRKSLQKRKQHRKLGRMEADSTEQKLDCQFNLKCDYIIRGCFSRVAFEKSNKRLNV